MLALGLTRQLGGAMATWAGLGLAPATGGLSLTSTVVGSYEFTSGGGQALTGLSQFRRAITGDGGPDTSLEQFATIASGPLSGMAVVASGYSTADAVRAANFESAFTAGTGLINSPTFSELIKGTVDAGLTAMGIANGGGCRP